MTPAEGRVELERKYSGFRNFRIEKKFPNQEEAQKWESRQFNTHPGGPKAEGPFYGYSHDYDKRK